MFARIKFIHKTKWNGNFLCVWRIVYICVDYAKNACGRHWKCVFFSFIFSFPFSSRRSSIERTNKLTRRQCTSPRFNLHENSFIRKMVCNARLTLVALFQSPKSCCAWIFLITFSRTNYYSNRLIENKAHKIWWQNVDHEKGERKREKTKWKEKENPNKVLYQWTMRL